MEEELLQEVQTIKCQIQAKNSYVQEQSFSAFLYSYMDVLCDLGAATHFMHELYDQTGWPIIDTFQKETSPLYWEVVDAYQNLVNYAKKAHLFDAHKKGWQHPVYQQIVKLLKQVEITSRTGDYQIARDEILIKKALLCQTVGLAAEFLEHPKNPTAFDSDESNWELLQDMWELYQNDRFGHSPATSPSSMHYPAQYTEGIKPLLLYIHENYADYNCHHNKQCFAKHQIS